jgi:predicted enzyme related to lactoylglutathione lyase
MDTDRLTRRAALGVAAAASLAPAMANEAMEKVQGIGGFFFRAKDPKAVAQWYADNLGITLTPTAYDQTPWRQEAGTTIFGPFKQDTKYFGDMRNQWMINFRVRDLDKMAAQLTAKGIKIELDPETYPNGRFALTHDPEGNPIQLWQPGGVDRG